MQISDPYVLTVFLSSIYLKKQIVRATTRPLNRELRK